MSDIHIIQPTSLSFEQILEDLLTHAKNKPDGLAWQDWFKHSNGTVVAEWVAGLATFRAYHETMRIREGQIDFAQLDSSVFNIAFNKGVLMPPALSAEMDLTINSPDQKSINIGDIIAVMGDYELHSLEAKTILGPDNVVKVVVGHRQEWVQNVPGLKPFQTFRYLSSEEFFASQLERFTIDGTAIPLLSDPDYLNEKPNDFILRRIMPSQSRIYLGNNIIGWYNAIASEVKYSVLTYDRSISESLKAIPTLMIDGTLTNYVVTLQPSFDPHKEEVREITRYYPYDGRVVTDSDYMVIIKKNFGGILEDVFSFNSDPEQHVYLLKNDNFGSGPQEEEYLDRISKLINSKRGLGMKVNYHTFEKDSGLEFSTTLLIPEETYTNNVIDEVNKYIGKNILKFIREEKTFTSFDLAIELSAKFGIQFFPTVNDTITVTKTDFFKTFYINVDTIKVSNG